MESFGAGCRYELGMNLTEQIERMVREFETVCPDADLPIVRNSLRDKLHEIAETAIAAVIVEEKPLDMRPEKVSYIGLDYITEGHNAARTEQLRRKEAFLK